MSTVSSKKTESPRSGESGVRTTTTTGDHLKSLGRAEFSLLLRNRTALFTALFVPLGMIVAIRQSLGGIDLGETGISALEAAMTGGIGMVLIMAVYGSLTSAYTARREELVLKRLRTMEASDREILIGTALPAAGLAFIQAAVMIAAGVVFLDVRAPQQPVVLVGGLLIGLLLLSALAAVTSAFTRTVESAQISIMPLFMISVIGSGLFIPLEALPERMASFCELLPVTGAMTLIRAGWLGGTDGPDLLGAALSALVWTILSVFAVQRWFRWEPRR
ncbi:ABC transporter permease [Streptomyces sp. 35G-GA-8]|uniref:ABC transporter permease n=1 Tax=Streptomyces sp. 35G-GA-8 TaxID=2939434 RepID=UPI00201F0D58|nr:ABC transporter permease [Streptomyces sp. 35G-GA-8]MCL7379717.1 ABC transporter permease [Streptomyces sp. 35G-GA-8]